MDEAPKLSQIDSLYIELQHRPVVETREIVDGLDVDMDESESMVDFDVDEASKRFDISKIKRVAAPYSKKCSCISVSGHQPPLL